jgi:hypothetical protein
MTATRCFSVTGTPTPIPLPRLLLRQIASNLTTPPAVPFARNQVLTLVLNQARDRMVDPAITSATTWAHGSAERAASEVIHRTLTVTGRSRAEARRFASSCSCLRSPLPAKTALISSPLMFTPITL